MKNNQLYLVDTPEIEEDFFGIHTNIAETLLEIIEKHDVNDKSFTIGLFGEWGSGKSFIINKLKKKLEERENITFLNIDVWKYSGHPLLRSILFDIDKQFKELCRKEEKRGNKQKNKYLEFKDGYRDEKGKSLYDLLYYDEVFESESKLSGEEWWGKLKELGKKYLNILVGLFVVFIIFVIFQFIPEDIQQNSLLFKIFDPILKGVAAFGAFLGFGSVFIKLLQKPIKDLGELVFFRNTIKNFTEKANFSPEQFEGIFKDMLSKVKNEKYVIVFDNLDRCEPKVAYETLSTIKTFMDIKNCFYIIPCDDEAIKEYLANDSGSIKRNFVDEFMDKIFQTYIRIPHLKEVERDKYIEEQLRKIDFQGKISEKDIEVIKEILYFAYRGESPRNIIRFINDYSTYFHLALNSIPELLDDMVLFTIMIAIKQKWYKFEKILLEHPTFFKDYPGSLEKLNDENDENEYKNMEGLKEFLKNISAYYIPKIRNKSFVDYIYFKKSEPSVQIAEHLRNIEPDKITLNDGTMKILLREFRKNTSNEESSFAVNSYITLAFIIKNLKNNKEEAKYYSKLVEEFWRNFSGLVKLLEKVLVGIFEKGILKEVFSTLNDFDIDEYKNKIEKNIVKFFEKPMNDKFDGDEELYCEIFKKIIQSGYRFRNPSVIKSLFNNWTKDNEYLNTIIEIISKNEKYEYLPEEVFEQLINDPIDSETVEILMNWKHDQIPKKLGKILVERLIERFRVRKNANFNTLNSQKQNLEDDLNLLNLVDISFVDEENNITFVNELGNVVYKLLTLPNNSEDIRILGVKFWVELIYFAEINSDLIDSKLSESYDRYIAQNSLLNSELVSNIKYVSELIKLNDTKKVLFEDPEIQRVVYEKLLEENRKIFEEISNKFELLLAKPIEIDQVKVLFEFLEEKDMNFDKKELFDNMLKSILKELEENMDIHEKLKYIDEKFGLRKLKETIISNKNFIMKYYKEVPEKGLGILKLIKSNMRYEEFYEHFLERILNYLKGELETTNSIENYTNISELIEKGEKKELLYNISLLCLERGRNVSENYLGIEIVEKINKYLDDEEKGKVRKLILDNENAGSWDEIYKKKIKELGLLEEDVLK